MIGKALLISICLFLLGCASTDQATLGSGQFSVSLEELLLLARDGSLEQVRQRVGPPPHQETIAERRGLFETTDHFLIEKVNYYGGENLRSIEVLLTTGYVGPCFPIERLPELNGAQEIQPSLHESRRVFKLITGRLHTSFRSAYDSDKCLQSISFRRRSSGIQKQ